MTEIAIIIGAGPAGLTAAYELLGRSDINVVILERSDMIGGISRTINYKGYRMDIGGHRFFSKSDRVMKWWQEMLPVEPFEGKLEDDRLATAKPGALLRMLERQRISRIYYLRKFFDYPVKLSADTIKNLGATRIAKMAATYLQARAFPRPSEATLEDFPSQSFRDGTLQDVLQGLHGESLGGTLCHHQERVGCPAHQGSIDHLRSQTRGDVAHPRQESLHRSEEC
ncbi:MAG: NAD(P)-binding protein [Polyangiaceae bacterium]